MNISVKLRFYRKWKNVIQIIVISIMKKFNYLVNYMQLAVVAFALVATSCSDDDPIIKPDEPKTANPSFYITDPDKLAMIRSMDDVDGTGRLYTINYTEDYMLDKVLKSGYTETNQLFAYIASLLFDKMPTKATDVAFGAGCSAFAVPNAQSNGFLMGRNYDFRHFSKDGKSYVPTSAILVYTAPEGRKKSISMVDGLNFGYNQGFYTNDTTDLSLMMGLPYAALDGINEDGFAIGVLALNENQTNQETGKPKIGTTVAIRLLLDSASTVKDAIDILSRYDMDMRGNGRSNYHYFMADAKGYYAIVEYTYPKGDTIPRVMEVLWKNDTLRCVTNFYVSPTMVGTTDGWGSKHGRDRYDTLRTNLLLNKYALTENDAMNLLKKVSQPPTEELTSQTQWSSLYNLTEKTLKLSILREYGKEYNFSVE